MPEYVESGVGEPVTLLDSSDCDVNEVVSVVLIKVVSGVIEVRSEGVEEMSTEVVFVATVVLFGVIKEVLLEVVSRINEVVSRVIVEVSLEVVIVVTVVVSRVIVDVSLEFAMVVAVVGFAEIDVVLSLTVIEVVFVVIEGVFVVIEGVAVLLEDVSAELEAVFVLIINTSEVVSVEIVEEMDTFCVDRGVVLEEEDVFIRFVVLDVFDTFCGVPVLENDTVELGVGGNVVSGLWELDVIFVLFEEVGKEVDWVEKLKVVLVVVVDVFPGVEPEPPGVDPAPPDEPADDEPEPESELKLVPVPDPDPELVPNV